jgi:hypothetical protein
VYSVFPLGLARTTRAADLGRRLLTVLTGATAAAFLLRALGHALGEPATASLPRLLWCLPVLAAVAWFAAAAARTVPAEQPERIAGLTAAGAGPGRIRALIAGEAALSAALGSGLTLLAFLILRNDVAGPAWPPTSAPGSPCPPRPPSSCSPSSR